MKNEKFFFYVLVIISMVLVSSVVIYSGITVVNALENSVILDYEEDDSLIGIIPFNATGSFSGQCRYAPAWGGQIFVFGTNNVACANQVRSSVNATHSGFYVTARGWTTYRYLTPTQQQDTRNHFGVQTRTARNQAHVFSTWQNNFMGDLLARGSWW